MKPTPEQIKTAIQKLAELKSKMPKYSTFGDNNHEVIDLEIKVLKGELRESEFDSLSSMLASQLFDVLEWKKGESTDWYDCRLSDLENFTS